MDRKGGPQSPFQQGTSVEIVSDLSKTRIQNIPNIILHQRFICQFYLIQSHNKYIFKRNTLNLNKKESSKFNISKLKSHLVVDKRCYKTEKFREGDLKNSTLIPNMIYVS